MISPTPPFTGSLVKVAHVPFFLICQPMVALAAYEGLEAIYASISSVAAITSTTFPQIALGIVTLAGAEKSYTFNVK